VSRVYDIKEISSMQADVLKNMPTSDEARRQVSKVRSIVSEAVGDSVRSATRAIKHGRVAAEDLIDEAEHRVKQQPFRSVGVAFASGLLAGALLTGIAFSRR
jgi:ElaB/YqjD/DUF883 family membrane-anchored ribosome-binding protein